jgi:hypothetical protein
VFFEIEANQQIRSEAHALPTHEHEQKIFREHQCEHEEHEEVEIGEETPVAFFMRHVAHGIDMDEEANAGDDQEHHERELVEGEREIGVEDGGGDPGAVALDVGQRERREAVIDAQNPKKRSRGKDQRDSGDQRFGQAMAEEPVQQKADERQNRDEPQMKAVVHSFIRFTWSTLSVFRVRKIEMMMASPTAASAAATTMTKKTKICPLT